MTDSSRFGYAGVSKPAYRWAVPRSARLGETGMNGAIRALTPSEIEDHARLVYISYSHGRDFAAGSMLTYPDWWLRNIGKDPYYRPEQTRVMELDGKLVSSVTCFHRPTHINGRIAKTACIGSVCTHPAYRGRGFVKQVLAEAADCMIGQGVTWAFLYGNDQIYGSSGWRSFRAWTLSAKLRVAGESGLHIAGRPPDPEADAPVMAELYDSFNARLTGSCHRSLAYWREKVLSAPAPWSSDPPYTLLERRGEPVGYYRGNDAAVSEIAWRAASYDVLAYVLRQWPGRSVSFPFCCHELLAGLRAISTIPDRKETLENPDSLTIQDSHRGLWRYFQDPDGAWPEIHDTDSLRRFMRSHEYAMWPVDRA